MAKIVGVLVASAVAGIRSQSWNKKQWLAEVEQNSEVKQELGGLTWSQWTDQVKDLKRNVPGLVKWVYGRLEESYQRKQPSRHPLPGSLLAKIRLVLEECELSDVKHDTQSDENPKDEFLRWAKRNLHNLRNGTAILVGADRLLKVWRGILMADEQILERHECSMSEWSEWSDCVWLVEVINESRIIDSLLILRVHLEKEVEKEAKQQSLRREKLWQKEMLGSCCVLVSLCAGCGLVFRGSKVSRVTENPSQSEQETGATAAEFPKQETKGPTPVDFRRGGRLVSSAGAAGPAEVIEEAQDPTPVEDRRKRGLVSPAGEAGESEAIIVVLLIAVLALALVGAWHAKRKPLSEEETQADDPDEAEREDDVEANVVEARERSDESPPKNRVTLAAPASSPGPEDVAQNSAQSHLSDNNSRLLPAARVSTHGDC